ncbi:MAG TPA: hypothetical protein VF789_20750 [Thermoanaerobaculia bacterium]
MDPSTISGAIIWGVVSGLATSALLVILGLLISRVALPAYLEFIYKGVDLRGVWIEERDLGSGARFSVQLSLEQRAHKVSGTGTLTKSGTGKSDYVQFFSIEGSTWEGFLVITMRSTNRKSLSFVAGLLKVKGRGESLLGHWVYRAAYTDEAECEKLHLIRQRQANPAVERTETAKSAVPPLTL